MKPISQFLSVVGLTQGKAGSLKQGEALLDARSHAKATILHLSAETFFAVLPLLVMSLVWPTEADHHPTSFWMGPEISMTSCVLYGLALSKLLQGSVVTSVRAGRRARDEIRQVAASYVALSLLPMLGIILSVTAINKILGSDVGFGWHAFQYINLVLAIGVFFLVGGHGIRRSETES